MSNRPPPGSVQEFLELLGEADTLKLIEAAGGQNLVLPKGVEQPGHKLHAKYAAQFGAELLAKLARYFGYARVQVPLAKKWRMHLYRAEGRSFADIALLLRMSENAVERAMSGRLADGRAGNAIPVADGRRAPKPGKHHDERQTAMPL
ncbi:MAG TPA: hypothetical protein PLO69_11190 [Gammaproteobacteria bacterium]|nr:hypothetical protein [Gammaproteobacteria bacterium]